MERTCRRRFYESKKRSWARCLDLVFQRCHAYVRTHLWSAFNSRAKLRFLGMLSSVLAVVWPLHEWPTVRWSSSSRPSNGWVRFSQYTVSVLLGDFNVVIKLLMPEMRICYFRSISPRCIFFTIPKPFLLVRCEQIPDCRSCHRPSSVTLRYRLKGEDLRKTLGREVGRRRKVFCLRFGWANVEYSWC